MAKDILTETSKYLSYILRHEPESVGLELDSQGWVDIDTLIESCKRNGRELDRAVVLSVVAGCPKKRYGLSDDGQRIRSVQGHSTWQVSMDHTAVEPPAVLYHGTAERFLESILEKGLLPYKRHHVHLSGDESTAVEVGRRHGRPVVLKVDAAAMHSRGLEFYKAENGVWLANSVPVEFLTRLE